MVALGPWESYVALYATHFNYQFWKWMGHVSLNGLGNPEDGLKRNILLVPKQCS